MNKKRNLDIFMDRRKGLTYQQIADKNGITRQRVEIIVKSTALWLSDMLIKDEDIHKEKFDK